MHGPFSKLLGPPRPPGSTPLPTFHSIVLSLPLEWSTGTLRFWFLFPIFLPLEGPFKPAWGFGERCAVSSPSVFWGGPQAENVFLRV